ncbi:major facilitator superfamily domain-containing protein [Mortierella sp. GBAus27b]|nr:major facilitator superfamily domain-containing protein [Mortierella sp. GBAus27b]
MYNCQGYIVAMFEASSLISILPTILQTLSAALVPFYTKVSDVVGRAQALTFSMFFYLLGYLIQGTSNSFLQYALGQIAYGIGSTGMLTLTLVLIADTTPLINRGIMFSLWDLSSGINIFTTQALTDPLTIGKGANWRNVYLIVGLISLVGAFVLLVPLWYVQRQVHKNATPPPRRSIRWLLHEYDTVGAVLITAGMSLTLLPMILASSFEGNWKNPTILGMFISGVFFFALLAYWEIKFTDRPIMPMRIWMDRTCFGGLVVGFFMTVMAAMNWQYYTLYLVVSRDLTFGRALLLERGYQLAYLVFQLITGFLMRKYNRVRIFVWVGIIVHTAGIGMMIPARLPTSSDALVVASQTIVGAAGGMAAIASTVAVTGAVAKKDIATVIGVTQILGSFGSAFGGALAGGVWTQYLPGRLAKHITGPYDLDLAMNSPLEYIPSLDAVTKGQLIDAYADSQMLMSIISMSLAVFACLCTVMMKHVDLRNDDQHEDNATEVSNKEAAAFATAYPHVQ